MQINNCGLRREIQMTDLVLILYLYYLHSVNSMLYHMYKVHLMLLIFKYGVVSTSATIILTKYNMAHHDHSSYNLSLACRERYFQAKSQIECARECLMRRCSYFLVSIDKEKCMTCMYNSEPNIDNFNNDQWQLYESTGLYSMDFFMTNSFLKQQPHFQMST